MALRKKTHDDEPPEWTAEEWDYYAWTSPYNCEHALTGATFCSGVGAAELASMEMYLPIQWRVHAEIAKAQSEILKHRIPFGTNVGGIDEKGFADKVRAQFISEGRIDLLVGGPPCQDYSIAGKMEGYKGERGNLALLFCKLARDLKVQVTIFENVLNLLNMDDNSFGRVLAAALGSRQIPRMEPLKTSGEGKGKSAAWPHCGIAESPEITVAWRVVNAKYFGLAQRRERIYAAFVRRDSGLEASQIVFDEKPGNLEFNKVTFGRCAIFVPKHPGVWPGCGAAPPAYDPANPPHIADFLDPVADPAGTLSTRECVGILRRARNRQIEQPTRKPLPAMLQHALHDFLKAAELNEEGVELTKWLAANLPPEPSKRLAVFSAEGGGKDGDAATCLTAKGLSKGVGNQTPLLVDRVEIYDGPGHGEGHLAGIHGDHPGCTGDMSPALIYAENQIANISENQQSTTLVASRSSHDQVVLHGADAGRRYALRRLSPSECFRLQGFRPDWSDVPGIGKTNKFKAAGNAMAVPCVGYFLRRAALLLLEKQRLERVACGLEHDYDPEDWEDALREEHEEFLRAKDEYEREAGW